MEHMQGGIDYAQHYQQFPQPRHEQDQLQQEHYDTDQALYDETGACLNEMGGPVKLFVGQVPRNMEEDELRQVLEVYGTLDDLVIIRDKLTGAHRGCAFASYYSRDAAEKAIEELHNRVTLPNSINPLQVRPAEGQAGASQEHKLFIGMIPKLADEQAIREVFTPFGVIDEVYILRHPTTGVSKGCAFLKFKDRESAITAIDHVNGLVTMDRGTSPLVVKFADSRRQRLQRARTFAAAAAAAYWPLPPQAATTAAAAGIPFPQLQQLQQQYLQQMQQMQMFGGVPAMAQAQAQAQAAALGAGVGSPGSPTNSFLYYNPYAFSGQTYGGNAPGMHGMGFDLSTGSTSPIGGGGATSPRTAAAAAAAAVLSGVEAAAKASRTSSQIEGPSGANLFIYHLPHDLTDADLATAFAPFGSVISAKVYMDKLTGESKGFGFVSYDAPESADAAIASMNGFQIGSKRLKVQHKRVHARYPEEMMMHESFMYMNGMNGDGDAEEVEGGHGQKVEGISGAEDELEASVGQMRIAE